MSHPEGPPFLDWLRRANGALGAWLVGPGSRENSRRDAEVPEIVDRTVQARLENQRVADGQGVERLEGGTLVYASLDGRAAGLLLEAGHSAEARTLALQDLARLLDYERWKPVLSDVARQQEKSDETVESIALRLAHQLERIHGAQICVAVPHATGVKIAGVSLRSDRRLLGGLVEEGSALDRVTMGQADVLPGVQNPMGRTVSDRRHEDAAYVRWIPGDKRPAGAVALWTPGGREPTGPPLADLRRALEAAGPRLVTALERRALAEAAIRDPLTGLLNRQGLQDALGLVSTTSAVLIYADLDHFKTLNDELGHPAGDAALVHIARILLRAVRAQDAVARIGGEEFAVWLPNTPLERGRQVAERLRQAIVWSDWQWKGDRRMLAASFGVAAWPETAPIREVLPEQADAALYEAKRSGRGQVVVAKKTSGT